MCSTNVKNEFLKIKNTQATVQSKRTEGQKSDDGLPTRPISSRSSRHSHTVSSTNQLNTCLEMNGFHYLSSTLKVSQLTFKVIVWKKKKKDTDVVGKTFPLSRATSLDFSFGLDRVPLRAEQHHSGTALWPGLLSLIFSLLCKYAPKATHITQRQPGCAAVWSPYSQQLSMLASSQQKYSRLCNSIVVPGDVFEAVKRARLEGLSSGT